ncbi:MAG: hypothetical protein AAGD22_11275 [Verrucomicrobiota bacterium]
MKKSWVLAFVALVFLVAIGIAPLPLTLSFKDIDRAASNTVRADPEERRVLSPEEFEKVPDCQLIS